MSVRRYLARITRRASGSISREDSAPLVATGPQVDVFDLVVPVYLNQQIVFDLLAVFEGGFSRISTIKISASESGTDRRGLEASIGASNVFALLGVSFSGERRKDASAQRQAEISEERVHTPFSLFAKLRSRLRSRGWLRGVEMVESLGELRSGDFVEFRAVLRQNPLIEAIETFKQLMEMALLFAGEQGASGRKKQKTKHAKADPILGQMEGMLSALAQAGSVELIAELLDPVGGKAVLTARTEFFDHGDVSEVIDGEFRVMGKVVRVIRANESINLLRRTSFGKLDRKVLDQLVESFAGAEEVGLHLPQLVTEVGGPALQVVPIAIFI